MSDKIYTVELKVGGRRYPVSKQQFRSMEVANRYVQYRTRAGMGLRYIVVEWTRGEEGKPEGLEVVARMRAEALGSRGFLDARLSGPSDRLENLVRESDATTLLSEKDAEIAFVRGESGAKDRLVTSLRAMLDAKDAEIERRGRLMDEAEEEYQEARARITELEAREVTADDVTDEIVARAIDKGRDAVRQTLTPTKGGTDDE